jgi:carbamate kinase
VRAVVSLSGQGLAPAGFRPDTPTERAYLRGVATGLAELAGHHELVVTCGDGPHLDLLMSEGPPPLANPQFDVIRAASEGAVGYLLAQEVRNALAGRPVAWLLTQVRVDPNDAAFRHPDATVGRVIDEEVARNLATHFHWQFRPEGPGWRRVVPAPEPLGVIEAPTVDTLVSAGVVVVCSSGGRRGALSERRSWSSGTRWRGTIRGPCRPRPVSPPRRDSGRRSVPCGRPAL